MTVLGSAVGSCFVAAFAGMFFMARYPALKPFVVWTFRGVIAVFAVLILGAVVFGPGMQLARDLNESLLSRRAPKLERRLVAVWCIGAGFLFSAVIAAFFAAMIWGYIGDVAWWFVAVCAGLVLLPWAAIGLVGRWIFRRFVRRNEQQSGPSP